MPSITVALLITVIKLLLLLLLHNPRGTWCQNFEKSRSVWVEQGLVKGKIFKIDGRQVQIFRGIPYAEPPVGTLRFKKPVRKQRWEREFSATEYGPPCTQFMDFHKNDRFSAQNMRAESEDCLSLNIFAPYNSEDESGQHPILVWVHGGSFLAGSSDTGIDMEVLARNLAFRNITFVSVNYRLGLFGFMSVHHPDGHVEGNFGIWDIELALEWVQRNIKQFNGDPTRVTLMGESAGAAAVSALAVSPMTKDLLSGAIALSGSAVAGWAIHRQGGTPPNWDMANIADYIRCNKLIDEADLSDTLAQVPMTERDRWHKHCNLQERIPECLSNSAGQSLNTAEMLACFRLHVNVSESPMFWRALAAELGVSKMVVDGELIIDSGTELIRAGARVPLLTGVARREWAHKKPLFYLFYRYVNYSREQVESAVRRIVENGFANTLSARMTNSTVDLVANATFLRYMQDVDFAYDMPGVVARLQDLESDVEFVAPCQAEVNAYVASGVPAFVYSFDFVPRGDVVEEDRRFYPMFGERSVGVRRRDRKRKGHEQDAFHGLDHAFIFTEGYSSNFHLEPYTRRDKAMSRLLTRMITNFVATGDPSTRNFSWPPCGNGTMQHASLNMPPKMIRGPIHFPTPTFWNDEVRMLSKYQMADPSGRANEQAVNELTYEERVQLRAYKRAWYALWAFVFAIALLIWLLIVCAVCHWSRRHNGRSAYDNIVVNR
ncbi:hypothetical protein niasHT_000100 [Heterodera trifolii]|uniref:Carboxylesterase type B domain-containing protein n=1 Tax=Heterodera trifolii TaxID=157864 RepID=A0ABD2M478_9BILA